jgi:hypothetical protein
MLTVPFKLNQDCRHHISRQPHTVANWPDHEAGLRQRGSLTVVLVEHARPDPGLQGLEVSHDHRPLVWIEQ